MTYPILLRELGLTQTQAARFLDVNERTSRRWASGLFPSPASVLLLLGIMVKLRLGPEDVKTLIGEFDEGH